MEGVGIRVASSIPHREGDRKNTDSVVGVRDGDADRLGFVPEVPYVLHNANIVRGRAGVQAHLLAEDDTDILPGNGIRVYGVLGNLVPRPEEDEGSDGYQHN